MKPLAVGCAALLIVCVGETRLEAQNVARSFDQLAVLVSSDDTITVVDAAGKETTGKIGRLSRESLILVTRNGERTLREADVARIRQRRDDSLRNGAIIGAGVGAALGVVGALITYAEEADVNGALSGALVTTGLGAAIGVGVDAIITTRRVIYENPGAGVGISMSALGGHGRRGVAVTVRF